MAPLIAEGKTPDGPHEPADGRVGRGGARRPRPMASNGWRGPRARRSIRPGWPTASSTSIGRRVSPTTGRLDAFTWQVPAERLGPAMEAMPAPARPTGRNLSRRPRSPRRSSRTRLSTPARCSTATPSRRHRGSTAPAWSAETIRGCAARRQGRRDADDPEARRRAREARAGRCGDCQTRRRRQTKTPSIAKTGSRSLNNSLRSRCRVAAIAQVVEHLIRNEGVGGSSPSCGTKQAPVATTWWCHLCGGGDPIERTLRSRMRSPFAIPVLQASFAIVWRPRSTVRSSWRMPTLLARPCGGRVSDGSRAAPSQTFRPSWRAARCGHCRRAGLLRDRRADDAAIFRERL